MSKITAYPSEVPSKTLYLDIEVDGITLWRWMEDRDDFNVAPVPKMLTG